MVCHRLFQETKSAREPSQAVPTLVIPSLKIFSFSFWLVLLHATPPLLPCPPFPTRQQLAMAHTHTSSKIPFPPSNPTNHRTSPESPKRLGGENGAVAGVRRHGVHGGEADVGEEGLHVQGEIFVREGLRRFLQAGSGGWVGVWVECVLSSCACVRWDHATTTTVHHPSSTKKKEAKEERADGP